MSFTTAVEQTSLLKDHLEKGLKALGSDSSRIKSTDFRKCEGSVDIDKALERIYPTENRWDYAIGYDGTTYFIEVHPADTSEVSTIEKKLQWLKDFLRDEAPELNKEKRQFHWLATSGVHILSGSSQERKLAQLGIKKIQKQLTL